MREYSSTVSKDVTALVEKARNMLTTGEPLEQFNSTLFFPELFEFPGVFLKYIGDRIGAIATSILLASG
jgi:hypothetical protein